MSREQWSGGTQRTSSSNSYHLVSPKRLLFVSFASSCLLFSFLFTFLFALRHDHPIHIPFAPAPLGANAPSSILGHGGGSRAGLAGAEVEDKAVLGRGTGTSVAEGAHRAVAGDLWSVERKESVLGGEDGGTPEVQGAAPEDGGGERLVKVSIFERSKLAEGKNLSRETFDSATETQLHVWNVSASQEATASEKLESTRSVQAVNFSTEASGPAMGAIGEFLQGRVDKRHNSSVHGTYASGRGGQWKKSAYPTVNYNSEATPVAPYKQGPNMIQESAAVKMDFVQSNASNCDVSDGSWVFDKSYPLYMSECPFIDEGFSCEANGRVDQNYMRWRWQPKHCNIPRFDARNMLEMLRGKRLVFVGDSINRNQWESMMCLLKTAVSIPSRIHEIRGRKITKEKGQYNFKFLDYNCSVEYYVTHFLVHENKARIGHERTKTLQIDTIERSSSKWKGADVLVFNSAHWWSNQKTNSGVNYYQEGDHVHPYLDASKAFQRALTTWASWVDRYINPRRTRVFFRSTSPSHFSGGEWNSGGHCRENTLAHSDSHVWPMPEINVMLEEISKQMTNPVTILNITNLSELRIDGHPSVYGRKAVGLAASGVQDCSHWCLPGVPDTWNELLFFYLMAPQRKDVIR